MKRKFCGLLVLPVIICMLLTGCTKENNTEQSVDVKEAFIKTYFTSDYEKRYTSLLQEKQSGDADTEALMERYYAHFSPLVTQGCLEAMMANREPYKYDERAENNQETITVKEIAFEEYDAAEGVYSFSVLLEGQSGTDTKTYEVKGQLSVERKKDQERVSHIYLGSYIETEG